MKKSYVTYVAMVFALGSACASAVDLSPDQQTELRERASALNAERQRNPSWDGGQRRVSETRGDVNLNQNQGEVKNRNRAEVKPKAASGKPKTKTERAKTRPKRTAKEMPGALVR